MQTGEEIFTYRGHGASVTGVAFSPDGRRLASSSDDRMVKVVLVPSGEETLGFKGPGGPLHTVAFSPNGRCLASGGWDSMVKIWSVQSATASSEK
jgi:WD40 repeat protein